MNDSSTQEVNDEDENEDDEGGDNDNLMDASTASVETKSA